MLAIRVLKVEISKRTSMASSYPNNLLITRNAGGSGIAIAHIIGRGGWGNKGSVAPRTEKRPIRLLVGVVNSGVLCWSGTVVSSLPRHRHILSSCDRWEVRVKFYRGQASSFLWSIKKPITYQHNFSFKAIVFYFQNKTDFVLKFNLIPNAKKKLNIRILPRN